MFKGERILVTGATGFIGSHLVKRLLELEAEVHVFLEKKIDYSRIRGIEKELNPWYGEISDYCSVCDCIENSNPQIIFHLAASRNVERNQELIDPMISVNLVGTTNLIRAVLKHKTALKCFINTGTCEEYGDGPVPFCEDQREVPVSPYSASKVATTYFCQMIFKDTGLPIVTLRPFLTYGPGQDIDMFIPSVIYHCLKGKNFAMTAGDQTREFNYVSDVVDAYLLAAVNKKAIGEIINIGNGIEYSIETIAKMVINIAGRSIELLKGKLPKRPCEAARFFCCNNKAKEILGWSPTIKLEDGLEKTINWYRNNLNMYTDQTHKHKE